MHAVRKYLAKTKQELRAIFLLNLLVAFAGWRDLRKKRRARRERR